MDNISKIIDEVMRNATFEKKSLYSRKIKDGEYQFESVKVKFTYKDNAIYIGNNKIADITFENNKPKFVFKEQYKEDSGQIIIEFYEEHPDKIKTSNEIEVGVTVSNIEGSEDSDYEYTFLTTDDFKVTLGDSDNGPNIKKFVNEKDLKRIVDFINEEANKDYKRKYIGDPPHRTH